MGMTSIMPSPLPAALAFEGHRQIAIGSLADVAIAVKAATGRQDHGPILIFDAATSALLDIDTRGSAAEVAARHQVPATHDPARNDTPLAPDAPRGRGRPRLGVVAREVTLLPRHWEWLSSQPGGASVALRKLVEDARRTNAASDAQRAARDSAYRFMSAIASPFDTFEDATRALFAGDRDRFESLARTWPADISRHAIALAQPSFTAPERNPADAQASSRTQST